MNTYHYPLPYRTPIYPGYYRAEAAQVHPMIAPESATMPKIIMHVTKVEPIFFEHLTQHKGQKICVITTVGKFEGTLDDVYIDHLALISHNKKLHIRFGEIVYFEKA